MSEDAPAPETGCPRCGASDVDITESPAQPRSTGDGGWIEVRKRVAVCRDCGEVLSSEETGTRPDSPPPPATVTADKAPYGSPSEGVPIEDANSDTPTIPHPLLEID